MPNLSEKADFSKFVMNQKENATVDGPTRTVAYTRSGVECDPAHPEVLARRVVDEANGTVAHYLKKATHGPEAGRLWNPHGLFYEQRRDNAIHQHLGRGQYEWVKVRADQFELYLTFLRTDDLRHLRQAERE